MKLLVSSRFDRSVEALKRRDKRKTFGFLWFQQGDKNLENVTHEEAVATLKATQDRVVLLVAKPETGIVPPPPPPMASDNSLSPQPSKPLLYSVHIYYSLVALLSSCPRLSLSLSLFSLSLPSCASFSEPSFLLEFSRRRSPSGTINISRNAKKCPRHFCSWLADASRCSAVQGNSFSVSRRKTGTSVARRFMLLVI